MTELRISELNAAGPLDGTEVLPLVQAGTTKKVTASTLCATGATAIDLTGETWPITYDLADAGRFAGYLIGLPAPASGDPLDSIVSITAPPAEFGSHITVRFNVVSGTMDDVTVNIDGSENGMAGAGVGSPDPWGVRATAVASHAAALRVEFFDGEAAWHTQWIKQ